MSTSLRQPAGLFLAAAITASLVGCSLIPRQPDPGPAVHTPLSPLTGEPAVQPTATTEPARSQSPTVLPATVSPRGTQPVVHIETLTVNPTSLPCNRAAPGSPVDISIPDDTAMAPGEAFSKTWRLVNKGSCAWSKDYALVWFSGERFGVLPEAPIGINVPPGQTVDLTLDLIAPQEPGTHQSNWKLRSADGILFGLGPNGDAPFWARILVVATQPPPPTPTSAPTATPSPEPSATPPLAGPEVALSLNPGDGLDLATGGLETAGAGDLRYNRPAETGGALAPQEGARLASAGANQPTLAACQAAPLSSDPLALDGLPAGTYLCTQSRSGSWGWLQIEALDPTSGQLTLRLQAWAS